MAYNKTFNPDALPAHAEPDQAAQALSQLSISQPQQQQSKPQPPRPQPSVSPTGRHNSADHRRPSPAAYAAQQAYNRPQQAQRIQTDHNYNTGHSGHPDSRYLHSPPPPADYGQGPRPRPRPAPAGYESLAPAPPGVRHHLTPPPRAYAPPDADSADLYPLFRAANVSHTGSLTVQELGSALVNADFTPFATATIRSLMRMFSTTPAGHQPVIIFSEFQNLWRFLAAWRELFERFDEDQSGKISLTEFTNALVAFGYRLSQPFVSLLYLSYNNNPTNHRRSSLGADEGMSFDLFVQACISLKRMTDVFKTYDDDRDGYVTLSFEEFLTEILKLRDS